MRHQEPESLEGGVDRSQQKTAREGGAEESGRCCLETGRTLLPEHKGNTVARRQQKATFLLARRRQIA